MRVTRQRSRFHLVGWVERGHDVEVLAVPFIPRDTHRFPRGKRR